MNFELSPDQKAMIAAAEQFAMDKIAPGYQAREKAAGLDRELLKEMGQLGFIAPEQSEAFGGSEVSYLTSGLIMEALSGADFNMAYVQLLGSLNTQILARYASTALAEKWIPKICRGEAVLGVALTEPGGGSDAANLQLRATKVEGGYILNGEKASISAVDQDRRAERG